jgi:hypothetical protein
MHYLVQRRIWLALADEDRARLPIDLAGNDRQYGKLRSCGNPFLGPENFLWVDSRAGYCLVYCPFSPPNRGYFIDSMDYIDSVLSTEVLMGQRSSSEVNERE